MPHCLIIAHRGASAYVPGNTPKAFDLALAQGAQALEMDIRQTRDGMIVVVHNTKIKAGKKKKRLHHLTLEEIRDFLTEKEAVLPLKHVFARYKGKAIFDIDIKQAGMEEGLVKLIKLAGLNTNAVFLNSNKIHVLEEVRSYWKEAPIVLSYAFFDGIDWSRFKSWAGPLTPLSIGIRRLLLQRFRRRAVKHQVYGVSLPYILVYKGLIQYFHKHDVKIYVWPPESERAMKKLIKLGVDGIKTGKPDVLKKVIDSWEQTVRLSL